MYARRSGYTAPQLHTHAVIFNVTERTDGSTRALQERALFDSQSFATAIYQSALTYELRNRGYEIETGRSGTPEIRGYSQDLDASSLLSQQMKRPHGEAWQRKTVVFALDGRASCPLVEKAAHFFVAFANE